GAVSRWAPAGDADGGGAVSATVSVGGLFAGDVLSATTTGTSIAQSYNSTTGVLTLSGLDSFTHYQTVLASVKFTSTSENPTDFGSDTSRTLTWVVNDGLLTSSPQTSTVSVIAVNDAPVNHLPAATPTANEDAQFVTSGLTATDVDADPASASQAIIVAISATHGTFNVLTNVANGLTAAGVVGNNTATVTLTGTQNQINTTLGASGLR